jgi:hypothetical protein
MPTLLHPTSPSLTQAAEPSPTTTTPPSALSRLSPSITTMIRLDHTHVLATFHKYRVETSLSRKRAIVETCCLALEVHAQLEEEIFYPALREVVAGPTGLADSTPEVRAAPLPDDVLGKSVPEHDEMRRLISLLRSMEPDDEAYDGTYMQLMRDVLHHVADEETTLLPQAERLLADQLQSLGAQMTKRRMQLVAPKAGQIVVNTAKAMPAATMLATAGTLIAGGYLLKRAFDRRLFG